MLHTELHQNLQNLGFKKANGLVMLTENWQQEPFGTFEAIELHHLARAAKLGAGAVFFRREFDENTKNLIKSEPVLYIFEKENFVNGQEHKDLHAKIWSASEIEVYFIVSETDIHIFNARKPANEKDNLDVNYLCLNDTATALEEFNDFRFSTFLFQSGTFWEQETLQNNLDITKSPYAILLSELGKVRTKLQEKYSDINKRQALDKLLLLTILVKFLEDKKDPTGQFALQEKYKEHQVKSFEEILRKNNNGEFCIKFLQDLTNDYNGKIFDILKVAQKDLEKGAFDNEKFIQGIDLQIFADFIKADIDIDTKQLKFWKQYAFDYLPVELLSAIYENFLGKEANKGVVYTPPFLVNFLVDEVMPLSKASEYFKDKQFKVLDPACGSGVFLVAAYKRMLQWWFINEYYRTGKIPEKFEPKICKNILENNIFGVDIQKIATQITIFSLTIAYLDKLEPKTFWDKIRFQDLTNNITDKDFFVWGNSQTEQNFDLVIGNPPFNEGETGENQSSVKVVKNSSQQDKKDIEQFIGKFKHKNIPKSKFALQFFEGAMLLAKKTCLIIRANILLYSQDKKSKKYRQATFTDFTIKSIFDFTHLRDELFRGRANTPVLAIIADSTPSKGQNIEHIIIKRLISSEKKLKFEIDHYDRHFIRQDWACNENLSFIWKTNLLGGGRLFHLIYRLSLLETLEDFIKERKKTGWCYNLGYIINHKNKPRIPADFITNHNTVKPDSLNENGNYDIIEEPSPLFVETRTRELYANPHIIFKLVVEKNKLPMAFTDDYLCFNSSFVGLSAPLENREEVYEVYNRLHVNTQTSNLYRAYILATIPKAIVYHQTSIIKDDIDNLPYPQKTEYLIPSFSEEILINDLLDYYRHLGDSIKAKQTGGKLLALANETILKDFGKAFCDSLNPIYAKNNKAWHIGKWHKVGNFIVYAFGYGANTVEEIDFVGNWLSKNNEVLNEDLLKKLVIDKQQSVNFIRKVVLLYKHIGKYDCVIFIKPITSKYWLQSIALRDADAIYMDLKKAGF